MKCKVRQLILKPLLEKSTLSTHRKVQNFQVQVQKLQMQRVESSKVKILRSRKVLPSQICLCYSLISISSFSIVKLLHCRSGRVAYNALLNAVTFWILNYVNLFTNNLKDNKNVAKLLLGAVGSGFWCFRSWGRRFRVPTALAIWFSRALGRMSKGRELRSNAATWLRPEAFKIRPNGPGYGKCGVLKPLSCPPTVNLFGFNIFILKQSARICYSRCCAQLFFFFVYSYSNFRPIKS